MARAALRRHTEAGGTAGRLRIEIELPDVDPRELSITVSETGITIEGPGATGLREHIEAAAAPERELHMVGLNPDARTG